MANVMGKHLAVLAASLCVAACAGGAGREKVVFVCGHPDDLAGVAGTALLLAEVDGSACAGRQSGEMLAKLIDELKPRAVFTHWPVDRHVDHI